MDVDARSIQEKLFLKWNDHGNVLYELQEQREKASLYYLVFFNGQPGIVYTLSL